MKKPLLLCISVLTSCIVHAQIVGQTSFEKQAAGTAFTLNSWKTEGFNLQWVNGFDQNRAYVDDSIVHTGKNALRISYPKDQYGPDNSGAQAPLLVTGATQYYISYWLNFGENFSWGSKSQGGKLPGLAGGGNCSGCAACTGTNGFTARLMWRTGGKAVLYLYHMDKQNVCGDDIPLQVEAGKDFYFDRGKWINVVERVKINTGSNYDGEVEVWLNQKQAVIVKGIKFVTNGDKVDKLYFSTFHGGSDSNWVPTVNCNVWFDDFIISTKQSDVLMAVSSSEITAEQEFNISPNPVHPGEKLSFSNMDYSDIDWVDSAGKTVYSDQSRSGHVPAIAPGLYVLKIRVKDEVVTRRVAVE